jgi:rare lipoprotein A
LRAAYNRTYTVRGRSYSPLRSAEGYDEVGIASWYGWESGTTTSMGTRFNPRDFSAASRVLPLPTCVQVTNLDNGLSALVLVNDRGPFVSGRLLDLSMGAAQALGVTRTGTARVRIVALPEGANAPLQVAQAATPQPSPQTRSAPVVSPPSTPLSDQPSFAPQQFAALSVAQAPSGQTPGASLPQQAPEPAPIEVQALPPLTTASLPTPVPAASDPQAAMPAAATSAQPPMPQPALNLPANSASPQNYVQTGAFTLEANAEAEKARLQAAGIDDVLVVPGYIRGQTFYRVQIGPITGVALDATLVQKLQGLGLSDYSVVQQ